MTKVVVDTDTQEKVLLSQSSSTLTVTETGSVVLLNQSESFSAITAVDNCKITIDGLVLAYAGTGEGTPISTGGDGVVLNIGASGYVAGDFGIESQGTHASITNAGYVGSRLNSGLYAAGDGSVVHNSGVMTGTIGVYMDGAASTLTNQAGGRIIGFGMGTDAVYIAPASGAKMQVVNHGYIGGDIHADRGNVTIVSDGTISGAIELGDGKDTIDLRGGVYRGPGGAIHSAGGNDTLITDNAKYFLAEADDGSLDTVKSSVSYTLTSHVDILSLIGNRDIDGTGTDTTDYREYLYGNSGDNTLKGLGGNDVLKGGGGEDMLLGGGGLDLFQFKPGYGKDTIRDFHSDQGDKIILQGFKNLGDVDKLDISQHGSDAWIDMGKGDLLVLKNIDGDALTNSDFAW